MALIQITTNGNYLDVEFNGAARRWEKMRIEKRPRVIAKIPAHRGKGGVEVFWDDNTTNVISHEYVDDFNGTNPSSDDELYDLLNAQFNPIT